MDDLISRQALMKEFSDFVRASNSSDFAQIECDDSDTGFSA